MFRLHCLQDPGPRTHSAQQPYSTTRYFFVEPGSTIKRPRTVLENRPNRVAHVLIIGVVQLEKYTGASMMAALSLRAQMLSRPVAVGSYTLHATMQRKAFYAQLSKFIAKRHAVLGITKVSPKVGRSRRLLCVPSWIEQQLHRHVSPIIASKLHVHCFYCGNIVFEAF